MLYFKLLYTIKSQVLSEYIGDPEELSNCQEEPAQRSLEVQEKPRRAPEEPQKGPEEPKKDTEELRMVKE